VCERLKRRNLPGGEFVEKFFPIGQPMILRRKSHDEQHEIIGS